MPAKSDRIELILSVMGSNSQKAESLIDRVLCVNRAEDSRTARPHNRALIASATKELSLNVCDRRNLRNPLCPRLDARRQFVEAVNLAAVSNLVVEVVGDGNDGDPLCQWNNPCVLKL